MFGRIFGRDKDGTEQAVCAQCGRTLLAGEWTRKITGPNGEDRLICSLCGPDHPLDEDEPPVAEATPANNGWVLETREDVQVSQVAPDLPGELEAKDVEIVALREQLARTEARNEELVREVALLRMTVAEAAVAAATPPDVVAEPPVSPPVSQADPPAAAEVEASVGTPIEEQTPDSSEPGERTWGETPAEFAAEFAVASPAFEPAEEDTASVTGGETAVPAFEDTQPLPVVVGTEHVVAGEDSPPVEAAAAEEVDQQPAQEPVAELTPDYVAALAFLQRGVDLFNVSRVPHKIAETNEQLGMPSVHVGMEEEVVVFTFMWSMGWYSFHVDTERGEARMADRGYEEITDLAANAGVRADGTVHLAPAQISRAAAQRVQAEDQPGPRGSEQRPSEPETPSVVAQKPPEILSKSLLGQRSDGEPAAWEKAKARDFDWDR
ncbi:MAG TPA: hypothetical protein VFH61_11730 [Thermoleophilia bacterium]|nr:hypothetical protein [Thermoleophilia bacterium]